ncbi:MAG: glycosyltransferase family 2 protein [Methylophaga sp.]
MKEIPPKISILTVCYNSAKTIIDTFTSVREQNYGNIEYIVVDGGSTDGTLKLIENSDAVTKYVSEPDEGIYDAMNKGISMATGDVIGLLNADDFFDADDVLSEIARIFQNQTVDACYADLVYVQQQNTKKIVRYWQPGAFRPGAFKRGWMPPHPTFFCRKSVYQQYGDFDLRYKIAADVELLFRFLEQSEVNAVYLPRIITRMRLGGTTNQSVSNMKAQNREVLAFLDAHYGRVSRFVFFMGKFVDRTIQFIRRPKLIKNVSIH